MKIELKNIKINETFSEETTMFKADLFRDGKKVGYCENDGRGGNTNYNRYPPLDYSVIQEIEEYCKTLPPIVYTKEEHGWEHIIDMTLEHWIDEMITEHLKKKSEKRMEKDYDKGVCYGTKFSYRVLTFKKGVKSLTISQMLSNQRDTEYLMSSIKKLKDENKTILNTNIPTFVLG